MNRSEVERNYSNMEDMLELFGNGDYKKFSRKPLLKRVREDLKSGLKEDEDYKELIKKWKYLEVKAKKTEKYGREFPDAVICVGLDVYKAIIEKCNELIHPDIEENHLNVVMKGLENFLGEHKKLLLFKYSKKRPMDNLGLYNKIMNDLVVETSYRASEIMEITSDVIEKVSEIRERLEK